MTERAIAFPFSIDSTGSILTTTNEEKIWQDRVAFVLLTNEGERVMRPTFGSQINALIFENNFSSTTAAERVVAGAFSRWLPTLKLNNVVALPDTVSGGLVVQITYTLPSGQPGTVTTYTNTANINRYGDIVTN